MPSNPSTTAFELLSMPEKRAAATNLIWERSSANCILSTEMGRGCEYPIFQVQPLQQSLAGSP